MKLNHISFEELAERLEMKKTWLLIMLNKELPEDEQMYICEVINDIAAEK